MRKVLFTILLGVLVFAACKKDSMYTAQQLNVSNRLRGNYHAYVDDRKMIFSVVSFTAHYLKPRAMNDEKDKLLFYAHGECYFSDYQYPIPDKGYIPCYFSYSNKADTMSFYYKGGTSDKLFMRSYKLYLQSADIFTLTDRNRILTFEKVK